MINMNTQIITATISTILLAFVLLTGTFSIGNVYATGNLDDEEEEEAISELQNNVQSLQESINQFELNLTSGENNIQANCPITEEKLDQVQQNITDEILEVIENVTNEQPQPEQPLPSCPLVPAVEEEEEQNNNQSSIIPPFVEPEPEPEPTTPTVIPEEGCQPIAEEEPEPVEPEQNNETTVTPEELEPIICPINGEILGYTNTTSGEQLPVSAGENNQTEVVVEEEESQSEEEPEQQQQPEEGCQPIATEEQNNQTSVVEEPTFNTECYCFELNEQTGELNVNSTTSDSQPTTTTTQ